MYEMLFTRTDLENESSKKPRNESLYIIIITSRLLGSCRFVEEIALAGKIFDKHRKNFAHKLNNIVCSYDAGGQASICIDVTSSDLRRCDGCKVLICLRSLIMIVESHHHIACS